MKAFICILTLAFGLTALRAQQSNQHTTSSLQQQQSSGWQQVNIGAVGDLYTIAFINPDTGWIAGSPGIFRTTDEGTTWLPWGPAGSYIKVQFLGTQIGWASTGSKILHTIDGGQNWISEDVATNNGDFLFVNPDTGITCVEGLIGRTTDGGSHWESKIVDSSHGLVRILAFDQSHIAIIGRLDLVNHPPQPPISVTAYFYSSDAGLTWERRTFKSLQPPLYATYTIDSMHAIVGGDSIIGVTSDGGTNWSFTRKDNYAIIAPWVVSPQTWYIGGASEITGAGTILVSLNGGTTWNEQPCPQAGILNSLTFTSPNIGWAVGSAGTVLHTTNGGFSSGVVQTPRTENLPVEVYPNPATNAVSFRYTLPTPQSVTLTVYTVSGQFVSSPLSNAVQNPGTQNIALSTSSLKSGDYIFLLKSRDYIRTGRFSIVK
jgi:photosystem II stability/assembly factor-like uncharacterized protein